MDQPRSVFAVNGSVPTVVRRHPLASAFVKSIHTTIFLVELTAIAWLVVTGVVGRRDRTVRVAAAAVAAEATIFLLNDRVCPLTPLAERLGASRGSVSDIFLPDAVARSIPVWSTALVALAALLHTASIRRSQRRVSAP